MPDYAAEDASKYEIWWTFGWPYETSGMMARLVLSGHLDRFPNLKVITHHLGGMTPFFEGRVGPGMDQLGARTSDEDLGVILDRLAHRPLDCFKMFYGDTAVFGSAPATRCELELFGADHVLFASDSPFDPERGPGFIGGAPAASPTLRPSHRTRAPRPCASASILCTLSSWVRLFSGPMSLAGSSPSPTANASTWSQKRSTNARSRGRPGRPAVEPPSRCRSGLAGAATWP